jgi:predicted phage tail protein
VGVVTATLGGASGSLTATTALSVSVTTGAAAPPAAPTSFTATTVQGSASDTMTLRWTPGDARATSFLVQAAPTAAFTSGVQTGTFGGTTTTVTQAGVPRGATFYVRIQAVDAVGASAWVNLAPFPITTP